jgi:hypothetical protein
MVMQQYFQYKEILLTNYEWSGGLGYNHKEVMKAQSARWREVKKGWARIIDESEWLRG